MTPYAANDYAWIATRSKALLSKDPHIVAAIDVLLAA